MEEQGVAPRKRRRWPKVLAIVIILLVLAGAGGAFAYWTLRDTHPFPESVVESANITLVYPNDGNIDVESIKYAKGVVSYTAKYEDSSMLVTIQRLPKKLDLDILASNFKDKKYIRTPLGKATVGSYTRIQAGSMVVDKSWILITAPIDTPQSDIENILQQLKAVK